MGQVTPRVGDLSGSQPFWWVGEHVLYYNLTAFILMFYCSTETWMEVRQKQCRGQTFDSGLLWQFEALCVDGDKLWQWLQSVPGDSIHTHWKHFSLLFLKSQTPIQFFVHVLDRHNLQRRYKLYRNWLKIYKPSGIIPFISLCVPVWGWWRWNK